MKNVSIDKKKLPILLILLIGIAIMTVVFTQTCSSLNDANNVITMRDEEIAKLETEVTDLKADLDKTKGELNKLFLSSADAEDLQEQLDEANVEIDKLKGELEAKTKAVEEYEATLKQITALANPEAPAEEATEAPR